MTLYIDASNSEKIKVGVDEDILVEDAREEKSQRLLGMIQSTLREKKISLNDITKIEVHLGPGSFTGLRVGVVIANALGWLLGVSVNGKDINKDGSLEPVYSQVSTNVVPNVF
ncbi:MAG: hypothetical protein Q7S60_05135 [bacterium]|nr:hypothetical protein [bacterium]